MRPFVTLRDHEGADLVVRTLDEVSRPALAEGRLARKTEG